MVTNLAPAPPPAAGGGKRCDEEGCNLQRAAGASGMCWLHGNTGKCQEPGCDKKSQGTSDKCISHGGGRRCSEPGCEKLSQGTSGPAGKCVAHGEKGAVAGSMRARSRLCSLRSGGTPVLWLISRLRFLFPIFAVSAVHPRGRAAVQGGRLRKAGACSQQVGESPLSLLLAHLVKWKSRFKLKHRARCPGAPLVPQAGSGDAGDVHLPRRREAMHGGR